MEALRLVAGSMSDVMAEFLPRRRGKEREGFAVGSCFTKQELLDLVKIGTADYMPAITGSAVYARARKEWQGTHDLYRDWLTGTLSSIGRRYGDEALFEILQETISSWLKPLAERILKGDRRATVEGMAAAMRGHLGAFAKIEEDEEKFTFEMPCPSGGKLITDGRYDPPYNYLKIAKPQLMTYGRKDFPVYCAHCYFQDALPLDWFGEPLWLTEPAQNLGKEPCIRYLYKNVRDVPRSFYERLGKTPGK
jgi:hypothetical protein